MKHCVGFQQLCRVPKIFTFRGFSNCELSVCGTATAEEVIKKSRFIAHVANAETLAEACIFVSSVSDSKATHNCWAYRGKTESKCFDDGEVGGTAGRPILGAIEKTGFMNVVVVVVRYFGGIKLGASGLTRAYHSIAVKALSNCQSLPLITTSTMRITISPNDLGVLYELLSRLQLELNQRYSPQALLPIMLDSNFESKSDLKRLADTSTDDISGEMDPFDGKDRMSVTLRVAKASWPMIQTRIRNAFKGNVAVSKLE